MKTSPAILNLSNVEQGSSLFSSLTDLQNAICVTNPCKVIAVASVDDDELSCAFAKAMQDVYAKNGSSAFVLDANLYNPLFCEKYPKDKKDKSETFISLEKNVYPSEYFKNGKIEKVLLKKKSNFDHIIIIVPSLKNHQEISLFKEMVDTVLVVTRRNDTTKKDLYNVISFLKEKELPLATCVVLKK